MDDPVKLPDPDILSGWKDIAACLGKSVRSAQRWEADLGLPVQRINTPDGGQIIQASRREIEAWRRRLASESAGDPTSEEAGASAGEDAEPAAVGAEAASPDSTMAPAGTTTQAAASTTGRRVWRLAMAFVAVLCGGLGLGVLIGLNATPIIGVPTQFIVDGRDVRALTESGRQVWSHTLASSGSRPANMAHSIAEEGDLDGDGANEIAVAVSYAPANVMSADSSDAVMLFDRAGHLRWTVQPTLRITQEGDVFDGPWRLFDVAFSSKPPYRLWAAYGHHTWRPSFVLEVSPDGGQRIRFLMGGPVRTLTHWPTAAHDYLVAGGIDAAALRPSVAILDLSKAGGAWPVGPAALQCAGCPGDPPAGLLLFPRSEIARTLLRPQGFVFRVRNIQGQILMETDDGSRPASLARLGADLTLTNFGQSARYWAAHRALEAEGKLTHPAEQCPELTSAGPFRVWTPAAGWREVYSPMLPAPAGTPGASAATADPSAR